MKKGDYALMGGLGILILLAPLFGQVVDAPGVDPENAILEVLEEAEALRNSGAYQEGLAMAEQALESARALDDAQLLVEAHYQTVLLHHYMENFGKAVSHIEIGLALARMNNLKTLEADLLNAEGIIEWKTGNLGTATGFLQEALEIWKQLGSRGSMANVSNNLGIIAYSRKDYRSAVTHYRNGIEWMEPDASDRLRASLYSNLAESLMPLDQLAEAERYLLLSLEIEERGKDPHNLAYTYFNLGELKARQDKAGEAVELYDKALGLQLAIENDWAASLTRLRLAEEYLRTSDTEAALRELMPGYEALKDLNAFSLLRDYCRLFAEIYETTDKSGRARYYRELSDWFAERVEGVNDPFAGADPPDQAIQELANQQNSRMVTTFRAMTLVILATMVALLVLENLRLRKKLNLEP
jgi:tetratricopeptide (TPR) repeat protein